MAFLLHRDLRIESPLSPVEGAAQLAHLTQGYVALWKTPRLPYVGDVSPRSFSLAAVQPRIASYTTRAVLRGSFEATREGSALRVRVFAPFLSSTLLILLALLVVASLVGKSEPRVVVAELGLFVFFYAVAAIRVRGEARLAQQRFFQALHLEPLAAATANPNEPLPSQRARPLNVPETGP